ncbi:MAG: CYTH domain-containing protein [Lachnospiraceae bacterium]|nr:CYTH domain-containing protein [Lachnospiraceae bacterium]
MENMEIERKFLVKRMPELDNYTYRELEQGYLSTSPTVRVRRENDEYYLTYKSRSTDDISRVEYNLPLTRESYEHLIKKADGNIITKRRYIIPLNEDTGGRVLTGDPDPHAKGSGLIVELDVFEPPFAPLVLAEVEFSSIEEADSFVKPDWLGEDVSSDRRYYNSYMSQQDLLSK